MGPARPIRHLNVFKISVKVSNFLAAAAGGLNCRQSSKLVIGKLKYLVKPDHAENTPGSDRDIAEYQAVPAISEQLAQAQKSRYARRGHYVHARKIHNNITVAAVTDDFYKRFKLTPHPRFARQVNKNNIIRPILKSHHFSPKKTMEPYLVLITSIGT
jgi:hypothetical protein